MIAREHRTLDGLVKRFHGTGFEDIFVNSGGLEKIDFTFLLWNAQKEAGELPVTLPIAKINYW